MNLLTADHTMRMPGSMTPDEAVAEKERLLGDTEFNEAYFNPSDPGHKAAQARMDELYAYAGGKGAITSAQVGNRQSYG